MCFEIFVKDEDVLNAIDFYIYEHVDIPDSITDKIRSTIAENYNKDKIVYRGLSVNNKTLYKFQQNLIYKNYKKQNYSSWTKDKFIAEDFAYSGIDSITDIPIVLECNIKNLKILDLTLLYDSLSMQTFENEKEVLIFENYFEIQNVYVLNT